MLLSLAQVVIRRMITFVLRLIVPAVRRLSHWYYESGYVAWLEGALIQDAMPDVSRDMREMFISGTCPKCWDAMFNNEDEV
jgi:hypothetical protein